MDIFNFFERWFPYIWALFFVVGSGVSLIIAYLVIMVLWRFAFGC